MRQNLSVQKTNKWCWILVIALVVVLQILMIHRPYVSILETWRQGDVVAVARNYVTESMNFFLPRIDVRNNLTGISGMEFPLYDYIVALMYKISGIIWIGFGKLFSLICSWVAVYFLYKIVQIDNVLRNRINPCIFVLMCFSIPFLNLFCGILMPEMLALALTMSAMYCFYRYKASSINSTYLVLFSCLLALAMLIRPYYAFFGFPLLMEFIFNLKKAPRRSVIAAVAGVLILLPFVAWYHFYVPYLNNKYGMGFYFYMGTPLAENLHNLTKSLKILATQLFVEFFAFGYVVFFALGIYAYLKDRKVSFVQSLVEPFFQFIYVAILACIVLTFLVGVQYAHFYYLGAVFPAVAIVSGLGVSVALSELTGYKKYMLTAFFYLLVVLLYFIAFQRTQHMYRTDKDFELMNKQKPVLLQDVPENAIVVIDGTLDRSYMYLLGRKGWMTFLNADPKLRAQQLVEFKKMGAQYLLIVPSWNGDQQRSYSMQKL